MTDSQTAEARVVHCRSARATPGRFRNTVPRAFQFRSRNWIEGARSPVLFHIEKGISECDRGWRGCKGTLKERNRKGRKEEREGSEKGGICSGHRHLTDLVCSFISPSCTCEGWPQRGAHGLSVRQKCQFRGVCGASYYAARWTPHTGSGRRKPCRPRISAPQRVRLLSRRFLMDLSDNGRPLKPHTGSWGGGSTKQFAQRTDRLLRGARIAMAVSFYRGVLGTFWARGVLG